MVTITIALRKATVDDFTRYNAAGERVWLHNKDFFVLKPDDTRPQYYRLSIELQQILDMIRNGIPLGLIYVIDTEGEFDRFANNLPSHQNQNHDS